jgi:hypothetical protein
MIKGEFSLYLNFNKKNGEADLLSSIMEKLLGWESYVYPYKKEPSL